MELSPEYRRLIDQLEQAGYNAVPHTGHCTVQSIVNALKNNRLDYACNVYQSDGDKLHSYPELKSLVTQLLGCRNHLKHNCNHFFCKPRNK
jgi:hypothetical protein